MSFSIDGTLLYLATPGKDKTPLVIESNDKEVELSPYNNIIPPNLKEGMLVSARVVKKIYGEKGIQYLHVFGLKVLDELPSPPLPAPKRAKKTKTSRGKVLPQAQPSTSTTPDEGVNWDILFNGSVGNHQ